MSDNAYFRRKQTGLSRVWRLIDLDLEDPYTCMATHEAVMIARSKGMVPNTVIFERYNSPSVFLGCHQVVEVELNTTFCREKGVKIVRRISGGGCGYMDPNQLNYAIIVDRNYPMIPFTFEETYQVLCNGIVRGLQKLGLNAEFRPVNDVVVNGRKISGSCQFFDKGVILQHGSLLVDFDINTMLKVLKVPVQKLKDKRIKSVRDGITWLKKENGTKIDFAAVKDALRWGFEQALRMKLEKGSLRREEKNLVKKLREKYISPVWTHKPDMLEDANRGYIHKAKKGVIRVSAVVRKNRILDILIHGDFSIHPETSIVDLEDCIRGREVDVDDIGKRVREFIKKREIRLIGSSEDDFVEAIVKAISRTRKEARLQS